MDMDRFINAFSFKKGVYAETANDPSFTNIAWGIIVLNALLGALGSQIGFSGSVSIGALLLSVVTYTVIFSIAVFLATWLGRALFKGSGDFSQVLRAAGLALVWILVGNLINLLGSLVAFLSTPLACLSVFLLLIYLAAMGTAVGEAHGILMWQGLVVVLIPAIVLAGIIICISTFIVILLGDSITNVFENIMQQIGQ